MKLKSEMYIGSVMLCPDILIKYPVPYDAIHPTLQTLYIEIQKRVLSGHPVEPRDLFVAFKGSEWANPNELIRIYNNAATPSTAKFYAEGLMNDYRRTKFKAWLTSAQELTDAGDIEKAESELINLYENNYEAPYLAWRDVSKTKTEDLPRIFIGESILDSALILDRGGLHIIAGRPGMGKTSFSLWIISQAVKNIPALFVSLEMPMAQIVRKLSLPEDAPLLITDTPSQTIEGIVLKAQLAKRHKDIGLVVVDYLQLIRTKEKFQNREQQVGYISSTLKQLAKQLNVPVIACCQLNRMMESTSQRRPTLANLRESGSIEQDCDSATLLYRPDYYYKLDGKECPDEQKGRCLLIIAKQRNAPTSQLEARWEPSENLWSEWKYYEYSQPKTSSRIGQISFDGRADWQ